MNQLDTTPLAPERRDLIDLLRRHRGFLLRTVRNLTDQQASSQPTVSELSLGGLIKHVTTTEANWARFIVDGPAAFDFNFTDPTVAEAFTNGFRMVDGETLAGLVDGYQKVAAETDALVATLSELNAVQPLPDAPWFDQGASWSARRVLIHIIAETSQHSGHADILRESIDGAKTMG